MCYEAVNCGEYACNLNTNGICKYNSFEELPCQELSDLEFHELLVNLQEVCDDGE